MVSDGQGNLYLAGSAAPDSAAAQSGSVVVKLDPHGSQFLYVTYPDGGATDTISAITVDNLGNAYITGWTTNPAFPDTSGNRFGTQPNGTMDPRSFVTQISPSGAVLFSVLLGGSAANESLAIALTAQGQILISGTSIATGFPATPDAYTVGDSQGQPFLLEMDASATKIIFSATGVGGSSIAVDGAGSIFVSGSNGGTDYPTTAGAYQTTFQPGYICYGLCQVEFTGAMQHLTKVDPTGSKLIYSTGLNGMAAALNGSVVNTGLAVDGAGNAYLTGTVQDGIYPFTAPVSSNAYYVGFVTKVDPLGASILFSVPVGGGGIQIDSAGSVYAAGTLTSYDPVFFNSDTTIMVPPAVLSWTPPQCLPNNLTGTSEAYVMKIDPASGNATDEQWIDGSTPNAVALALASGTAWITGATSFADVPLTPGAVSPSKLNQGLLPGAFLASVDFSQPPNAGPVIGCVLDAGNLMHSGPVAANQVLSIFGANLGPSTGAIAPDGATNGLGGISVSFDGVPAPLFYASNSQINLAVPQTVANHTSTVMQVSVNGTSLPPRQFPVVSANPNIFADLSSNMLSCGDGLTAGFSPIARNSDGSLNTCTNPAKAGSVVSLYAEGFVDASSLNLQVSVGNVAAQVIAVQPQKQFVWRIDIQLPSSISQSRSGLQWYAFALQISTGNSLIGPIGIPNSAIPNANGDFDTSVPGGQPLPLILWVTP
jgi:uncharacterized protein (TIGR03437 family)